MYTYKLNEFDVTKHEILLIHNEVKVKVNVGIAVYSASMLHVDACCES